VRRFGELLQLHEGVVVNEQRYDVQMLLAPVLRWMSDGGDAWQMANSYWRTRWTHMARLNMLRLDLMAVFSEIDSSLHRFEPSSDRTPDQIDELTLRTELAASIQRLRSLGALD
jgi:nicotinamide riboside kinase